MPPLARASSRKRPVNLTLSASVVKAAKAVTDNLSGVVEQLLSDYVRQEQQQRIARTEAAERAATTWNSFNSAHGSFADEYSTL